jgi:hypothetical protein
MTRHQAQQIRILGRGFQFADTRSILEHAMEWDTTGPVSVRTRQTDKKCLELGFECVLLISLYMTTLARVDALSTCRAGLCKSSNDLFGVPRHDYFGKYSLSRSPKITSAQRVIPTRIKVAHLSRQQLFLRRIAQHALSCSA